MSFVEKFQKKISDLLFPPICIHCQIAMNDSSKLFCSSCLERLNYCIEHPILSYPQKIGLFPFYDVGRTLYHEVKKNHFSDLMASFIFIALCKQDVAFPLELVVHEEKLFSIALKEIVRSLYQLDSQKSLFIRPEKPLISVLKRGFFRKRGNASKKVNRLHLHLLKDKEAIARFSPNANDWSLVLFVT
jgi:hypothetical protein